MGSPGTEGAIPKWDDSDAEQQTLQEVHSTFQKERTREIESARDKHPEGGSGDNGSKGGTSVLEKWMQSNEEKKRQKQDVSRTRKTGLGAAVLNEQSKRGNFAIPPRTLDPYQPFVVKDSAGGRFLYFFNEGDNSFYEAEEEENEPFMGKVAEKAENLIKRGWREFFAVLRIVTSIAILLVIEASNFALNHVARPLCLALLVTLGNHFLKPVLAAVFNMVLQPVFIFLWNVLAGARNALDPAIQLVGAVLEKVAIPLRAFRLAEVTTWNGAEGGSGGGVGRRRMIESDSEVV